MVRFPAMVELDLHDNDSMGGAFPWAALLAMGKLEVLHMGGNDWQPGSIPAEVGRRLGRLRELSLHGCQLKGALPPSLGLLRRLALLDLDDNDELELPEDALGPDDGSALFETALATRTFLANVHFETPQKSPAKKERTRTLSPQGGGSSKHFSAKKPKILSATAAQKETATTLSTSASEGSFLS